MDRKAGFLFAVLLAGILGPLSFIWESWHRTPSICPACLWDDPNRPVAKASTGTCGYFVPMLNATCPDCGRLWYDTAAPDETPRERWLSWIPRSRYPTVFSDSRICAMEGVYATHLWPR